MKKFFVALLLMLAVAAQAQILRTDTTQFKIYPKWMAKPADTTISPFPSLNTKLIKKIIKQMRIRGLNGSVKDFNVANYGATPNDSSIDETAFANCFAAAAASPYDTIYIRVPAGVYQWKNLQSIEMADKVYIINQYGMTIRLVDNANDYSAYALEFNEVPDTYNGECIILGGKGIGNWYNQQFPYNPHGGSYNSVIPNGAADGSDSLIWKEAHGQFFNITGAKFGSFYQTRIDSCVMDGIVLERCDVAFFYQDSAYNHALMKYSKVKQQNTAMKSTRRGMGVTYLMRCIGDGGGIGYQASFPQDKKDLFPASLQKTITVQVDCKWSNYVQNPEHIEDCFKNFWLRVTIIQPEGLDYVNSCHISNDTYIAWFKYCIFQNTRINFNQAQTLKFGHIDHCMFISTYTTRDTSINQLTKFIEGFSTLITNSSFVGKVSGESSIDCRYIRKDTIVDFTLGAKSVLTADSCYFKDGTQAISLRNGGAGIGGNEFINVPAFTGNTTPSDSNWQDVFESTIDMWTGRNAVLGKLRVTQSFYH